MKEPKLDRVVRAGVIGAVVLSLAACNSMGEKGDPAAGPERQSMKLDPNSDNPLTLAAYWGEKYEKNPNDTEAALNYGQNLRYIGRHKKAVSVLAGALVIVPKNPELLAEYGKALTETNRLEEGLDYLRRADALQPGDWKILSAQGVTLDKLSRHGEAQRYYESALSVSPDNPTILNNYALSEAENGRIEAAENLLRRAVQQPSATAQMRQNLALILGLQGKFEDARKYASLDLPPDLVNENMEALKMMVNEPSPWEALKELDH